MSYKSTQLAEALASLLHSGRLRAYVPLSRGAPKRRLYLTDRAAAEISNSALQLLAGKAKILGALDTWVLGLRITGSRRRGDFIVPLDGPPPAVWEIKVRAPAVQGRLFVRFLAPDTLLMTHGHTRGLLDSGFWGAMQECVAAWDELFPHFSPFEGESIHDYITFNCSDFPCRARKPKRR